MRDVVERAREARARQRAAEQAFWAGPVPRGGPLLDGLAARMRGDALRNAALVDELVAEVEALRRRLAAAGPGVPSSGPDPAPP